MSGQAVARNNQAGNRVEEKSRAKSREVAGHHPLLRRKARRSPEVRKMVAATEGRQKPRSLRSRAEAAEVAEVAAAVTVEAAVVTEAAPAAIAVVEAAVMTTVATMMARMTKAPPTVVMMGAEKTKE